MQATPSVHAAPVGSTVKTLSVKLVARDEKAASGQVTIQEWDAQARAKRALKTLAKFWAGAVFSILLPLAHFVLVPGLFLAGPVVAWVFYHQEKMITGGEALCPSCGKPFKIAQGTVKWPYEDLCAACHESVKILPA